MKTILCRLVKIIRTIAVIGTDAIEARLGGYSGPGNNKISILEGIKKRAGAKIKCIVCSRLWKKKLKSGFQCRQLFMLYDNGKRNMA